MTGDTDNEAAIAREVHRLLLAAHPTANDAALTKAAELSDAERNTTIRPRDDYRAEVWLSIQRVRKALAEDMPATEVTTLLHSAIGAAENWIKARA